jgi:hypothetical protein
MSTTIFHASARALGRPLAIASLAAALAGAAAVALSFPLGATASVLPGFATAWLFFAGLAAGAVALACAARVAQGRFLEPALPFLEGAGAFLPVALLLLAPSFALARFWVPGQARAHIASLAIRDVLAFVLLWLFARRALRHSGAARWEPPALRDAILYLLAFVCAVSLWTVDLVMNLYEGEPSGIVPVQAFMAAFVAAIAWASLLSSWRLHALQTRLDLGRMLFGFSSFWAYLVLCSFLPVWYANLPGETGEILLRTSGGWQFFSGTIVLLAFVVPFLVLFSEDAKRRRASMTVASVAVLLGLFAERALLVLRPLPQPGLGLPMIGGAVAALGMAGLFVLFTGSRLPAAGGA